MGHWYNRQGAPRYSVVAANGRERSSTLADARKLGLVPSVTEVLQMLAKPALTQWMVKQVILAALGNPLPDAGAVDAHVAMILEESQRAGREAAEEGDRIHNALECAMKGAAYPIWYAPHVAGAMERLRHLFPDVTDWTPEASFACPEGYGGKVDLHSPSTGIVVDWKSKEGDLTGKRRLAYDQNYQLAAYQVGLGLPRAVCANIFVSRDKPGQVASHIWPVADVEDGAKTFRAILAVWKLIKGYDGGWTT